MGWGSSRRSEDLRIQHQIQKTNSFGGRSSCLPPRPASKPLKAPLPPGSLPSLSHARRLLAPLSTPYNTVGFTPCCWKPYYSISGAVCAKFLSASAAAAQPRKRGEWQSRCGEIHTVFQVPCHR